MSNIIKLTASEIKNLYKKKELTATEVTTAYINQIEKNDININAFITKTFELALEQAKIADKNIQNGNLRLLEGIPIGIKDIFCTKDIKTTCASQILSNFIPKYESTVTQNIKNNGAICLGKLNMDEFAMGSASSTGYYGQVINPLHKNNDKNKLVPGGSSGGSSAAVRAYMCPIALGSDTGGSVRQPAAFTGAVGFKPSYGLCSRYGIIAFSSSLDQAGVITRSVTDSALALQSIVGFDSKDSTSLNIPTIDFQSCLKEDIKNLKVGIVKEYKQHSLPKSIQEALDKAIDLIKSGGGKIIELDMPHINYGPETYYIISTAEASSNLSKFDGIRYGLRDSSSLSSLDDLYIKTRDKGFGSEVKRRILLGTYVLSSKHYNDFYLQAQKVRHLIIKDFNKAFEQVDAILTPTTPNTPYSIDYNKFNDLEQSESDKRLLNIYLNDTFTVNANLTGNPAISLPMLVDNESLPNNVQLIAPHKKDNILFNLAYFLERNNNFSDDKLNNSTI